MSYEGYIQCLCEEGHYWKIDAYDVLWDDEVPICPKCGKDAVWQNNVDITNGSYDEEGERIDGYVELKVKSETSGVCSSCGKKHVCDLTYQIPEDINNEETDDVSDIKSIE